jgi:hypothetical protein
MSIANSIRKFQTTKADLDSSYNHPKGWIGELLVQEILPTLMFDWDQKLLKCHQLGAAMVLEAVAVSAAWVQAASVPDSLRIH